MTFSIVGRCERTGQLGVGAITAGVGVGKLVPHALAGVGAIATQASVNPYWGIDGIRLLADGASVEQVLERLSASDPGRDHRQCGIVDAQGRAAAWSGAAGPDWTGHLVGAGFATQGNRLVGRKTLEATAEAFSAAPGDRLVERLMRALEAGEATGADREGARSGALYVVDVEEYPLWDARIDDAPDPAAALRALYEEMAEELIPHVRRLPTRADPLGELTREQAAGRS